jgi:hypothetical protein
MFLKDFKHDFKLFEFIIKKKNFITFNHSIFLFSFNKVNLSTHFIKRITELLKNSSFFEMKFLLLFLNVHLDFLISSKKYSNVIRLLFHYKHLNSANLICQGPDHLPLWKDLLRDES